MEWFLLTLLRVLLFAMVFRIGFWFGKRAHEVGVAKGGRP
jgi:hypothetical protein